jgi:hypothetical protein
LDSTGVGFGAVAEHINTSSDSTKSEQFLSSAARHSPCQEGNWVCELNGFGLLTVSKSDDPWSKRGKQRNISVENSRLNVAV